MRKSIDEEVRSGAAKGLLAVLLPALLLVAYVALPGWAWLVIVPASFALALCLKT